MQFHVQWLGLGIDFYYYLLFFMYSLILVVDFGTFPAWVLPIVEKCLQRVFVIDLASDL